MTILVTGVNFVLDWLFQSDEPVITLDKLTYAGNVENLQSLQGDARHTLVQGDIGDRDLVAQLLATHQLRVVINFAAESHVDRSIHGPGEFIQANIVGTFELLEAIRLYWSALAATEKESFHFLHVSTDEVYGSLKKDAPAFTEQSHIEPNSPYSASKAASDHLVRAWHHTYGLPAFTTNCSNNYDPYHFPEKLIPLLIVNSLAGKPLPVYGDGQQIRDWLYVTDSPGHDRRYAIDARKLESELGWKPAETFETGIRKTVQWYLSNPDWVAHVQGCSYREWVPLTNPCAPSASKKSPSSRKATMRSRVRIFTMRRCVTLSLASNHPTGVSWNARKPAGSRQLHRHPAKTPKPVSGLPRRNCVCAKMDHYRTDPEARGTAG